MQTIQIYLSDNSILGVLSDTNPAISTVDRTYFARQVKLYTGLNNSITINCIDDSQSLVNTSNLIFTASIFDSNQTCPLIVKTAINNANVMLGTSVFTINNSDLSNVSLGYYDLGITVTDAVGSQTPLFINDNFRTRLPIQVQPGPVVQANVQPICLNFLSTQEPVVGNLAGIRSQLIAVLNQPIQSYTTFNLQANLVNFSGNIRIQGSTSTMPTWASPGGWETSIITTYNGGEDFGPPTNYGFGMGPGGNYGDFGDLDRWNFSNYSGPVNLTTGACVSWLTVFVEGTGSSGIPLAWPNFAPANTAIANSILVIGNV